MGCKYVKDFDFGPAKTYVKGYARGGEAKVPTKAKVNMNQGGSCYAKGGYAKGGKSVVEKETGERYPSRKAMMKHEAEETPRMQREEVIKRAEIKAPARKMVPVAARTPMVMKKGGNVKTRFPDGGPVQGAQMQAAPMQGGLNQMRQNMGQPMAAQQFNPQQQGLGRAAPGMMQQGMPMQQMGQQFNQQMMNPMMGGMGGYGMGQMGRMPPQMGGMGGYPMGAMGGYGMMRGPMGMMGGYPRGMMGGFNPMMGGYNPMMGGMGGYGMGRMMGGMGGYGGGYGYNQPMYPPMGGMQGYGARGQFGQPQQQGFLQMPTEIPPIQRENMLQSASGAAAPQMSDAQRQQALQAEQQRQIQQLQQAGGQPAAASQMSDAQRLAAARQIVDSRPLVTAQMMQEAQERERQRADMQQRLTSDPTFAQQTIQNLSAGIMGRLNAPQQQGVPSYNAQPMIQDGGFGSPPPFSMGQLRSSLPPMAMAKGGKVSSAKVGKVMGEFKSGKLHSGSSKGPLVKNRQQAVAIAMSEGRKAAKR